MDRNRVTKFLFGGFLLVVLVLALVFSLLSGGPQTSSPVLDSAMPAAPLATETETVPPAATSTPPNAVHAQ